MIFGAGSKGGLGSRSRTEVKFRSIYERIRIRMYAGLILIVHVKEVMLFMSLW